MEQEMGTLRVHVFELDSMMTPPGSPRDEARDVGSVVKRRGDRMSLSDWWASPTDDCWGSDCNSDEETEAKDLETTSQPSTTDETQDGSDDTSDKELRIDKKRSRTEG